jgi:hypothetical protein
MKRRGIGAAFSDEDLEMLRALWLERGRRAAKAADRSPPPKRAAPPRVAEPAPDRRTASRKKKTDKDGPGCSSRD